MVTGLTGELKSQVGSKNNSVLRLPARGHGRQCRLVGKRRPSCAGGRIRNNCASLVPSVQSIKTYFFAFKNFGVFFFLFPPLLIFNFS